MPTTAPCTDLDRLIAVYTTAADALRAVRDLAGGVLPAPSPVRRRANENGRTAAKIRARLTRQAHKTQRATAHKTRRAWTAAKRKAHGAKMRAMWARKRAARTSAAVAAGRA